MARVGPLIASVLLASLSLFVIQDDLAHGLFGLFFFGGCAVVLGGMLVIERRTAASLARTDEEVSFAPGTRLVVRQGVPALASLAFLLLGITFPPLFPGVTPLLVGILSAGLGAVGLLAVASGRYRRTILVEPDGLRFVEPRRRYRVPWDGLTVEVGALSGNEMVLLTPARVEDVLASVEPPSEQLALARALGSAAGWGGAPIVIMALRYGVSAGPLAKALARYAADAGARDELRARPALSGGG